MQNDQSTIINYYTYVIEHFHGYMYLKDLQSRYIAVSKSLAVVSGFKDPLVMIGKSDFELGWEDLALQFKDDDDLVITNKEQHTSKYLMPLTNEVGSYMLIKTDKSPVLDSNNNVIAILGVATDISQDLAVLIESFEHLFCSGNENVGLTKLESKVITLLTFGKTLNDIQHYLRSTGIVINVETLLYLKKQIFRKLGINSVSELIKFYSQLGINNISNIVVKNIIDC